MASQPPSPNPIVPPEGLEKAASDKPMSDRDAYNLVSDVIVGANLRKSDNWFQLKVIMVCSIVGGSFGAIAGALLADPDERWVAALITGLVLGFAGVVLGLFGSGIYLMVYRAVRHMKGKHD